MPDTEPTDTAPAAPDMTPEELLAAKQRILRDRATGGNPHLGSATCILGKITMPFTPGT